MAFALAFSAFMLCGETVSTNAVTAFLRVDNSRFQMVTSCWCIVLPAGTSRMIKRKILTFGFPFLRCRKNTYISKLDYSLTDENLLKSHFFRTSKKISAGNQRIKGWKGNVFLLALSQDPPTALIWNFGLGRLCEAEYYANYYLQCTVKLQFNHQKFRIIVLLCGIHC